MSSRWVTKRAFSLHLTLALVLPAFGALTWWQVRRAISGNTLSYVYSFEWPLFGAYAVYLWWKLVHEAPSPSPQRTSESAPRAAAPDAPPAIGERPTEAGSPTRSPQAEKADAGRHETEPVPDQGTNPDPAGQPGDEGAQPSAPSDPGAAPPDEELAAYNRYLAQLAASGARKQLFSSRRGRRRS